MSFDHDSITRYPEHHPARALLRWCEAIACRNFRQAVRLSSLPAQRGALRSLLPKDFNANQIRLLARWWKGRMIQRVEVHAVRMRDSLELAAELTATLHVVEGRIGGRRRQLPPERVCLWCYRENTDGEPDGRGEWRVDYMSMAAGGERV